MFLTLAIAVAIATIPAMLAQAPGGLSGDAILDHLNVSSTGTGIP